LKKKILFINPGHVKSVTDTYNYCDKLNNNYDVTYLGFCETDTLSQIHNFKIIYLNGYGNNLHNKIKFLRLSLKLINSLDYDAIFINYFLGASFLSFFSKQRLLIDVRTSFIHRNKIKRYLFNKILKFEVRQFDKISCISEGLKSYLGLPSNTHVLPLGANMINTQSKDFKNLNLLYIGTLYNRNIDVTIYGFKKFIDKFPNINISYNIISNGPEYEIQKIRKILQDLNLEEKIVLHGEIRYPDTIKHFENNNIGISFIPITEYFDNQPPTKTFEYLLAGMAVIATKTKENRRIINDTNGILINDNSNSFAIGLEKLSKNLAMYNSFSIASGSTKYTWEHIINNTLLNILFN
jgi:glycosyltransferase involved in cell wall biosynthesis